MTALRDMLDKVEAMGERGALKTVAKDTILFDIYDDN